MHTVKIKCGDLPFNPPREDFDIIFANPAAALARILLNTNVTGACTLRLLS
jgi:hypothetical protein